MTKTKAGFAIFAVVLSLWSHFGLAAVDSRVTQGRHLIAGRFYVFRNLKNYTVFLSMTDPAIAYGVLALSQPFEDLIGPHLPVMTETVLLPFKDKIIYDGLMSSYGISFGPGIRRSLNENFKETKARYGIVTVLPMMGNKC